MPRPLRKKPPPRNDTPFRDPQPCNDIMLMSWRNMIAHDKPLRTYAHVVEPIIHRLDAAERLLASLDQELGEVDLPLEIKNLHKAWMDSKGENQP